MEQVSPPTVRSRVRPAIAHLLGSALFVGLGSFGLVYLWYPPPFASLAGGLELLTLLLVVDIVLGPLLTFVVASPGKQWRVLARDLAVILAVQLSAMGYGLYTLSIARPVGLVFEVDHMRVISAADVDPVSLREAPAELRELSWTGPRTFAAVKPTDADELMEAVQLGLAGVDLAMIPKHWRTYESQRETAWRVAAPIAELFQRHASPSKTVARITESAGVRSSDVKFLPVRTRRSDDWIVLLSAPDARPIGLLRSGEAN